MIDPARWPVVRSCDCEHCTEARRRGYHQPRYPTPAQRDLLENYRLHPAVKNTVLEALVRHLERRGHLRRQDSFTDLLQTLQRHVRRAGAGWGDP